MDVNFKKRKPRIANRMGNLIWSSITGNFYTSVKELAVIEKVSPNTVNWHLNNKELKHYRRKYQKIKIFDKLNNKIYNNLQEAAKDTSLTLVEIYSDIFNKKKIFDYVFTGKMAKSMMIKNWEMKGLLINTN